MFNFHTTGQIVDKLISIKDEKASTYEEIEAINLACNFLEKFPTSTNIDDALEFVEEMIATH